VKSIITILFSVFILSQSVGAYEIKAEFENRSKNTEVKEGQAFDAYIRIWPFENEDVEFVKKALEEKSFLDFFYIAKVYSVSFSKNNETVMEIYAKAILKKHYVPRTFYLWPYKSLTIPFDLVNITPVKNALGKEFVITEQKFSPLLETNNRAKIITIAVFILVLILGIPIYRKIYLKNKIKKQLSLERKEWSDLFLNASSRGELENIYLKKDEWLNFVGGETPPILHFLTTINSVQFKKEWTEFEQLQVADSFDEIRGMFERN
jgi:hypothetical protein